MLTPPLPSLPPHHNLRQRHLESSHDAKKKSHARLSAASRQHSRYTGTREACKLGQGGLRPASALYFGANPICKIGHTACLPEYSDLLAGVSRQPVFWQPCQIHYSTKAGDEASRSNPAIHQETVIIALGGYVFTTDRDGCTIFSNETEL